MDICLYIKLAFMMDIQKKYNIEFKNLKFWNNLENNKVLND